MKLSRIEESEVQNCNDSNKLKIYLEFVLNKKYDWIKKINNLELLKKIILLDLAVKINSLLSDDLTLFSNSKLKNTLKGMRYSTITLLLKEGLITKNEADRFEAVIMLSKPKFIKGKHYNKKRKQKKAVSQ